MHHYKTLRIIFALRCVHVVYTIIIFPYCISSATIFPISTIFSPSFFVFSSAIFFSMSIYCGFTSFYHYAALVVPSCTWLCFFLFSFVLLMWKPLFSADNSFFEAQLYIGISPIILFKNLTLFMCSNLLVRHYSLSCLCLYRLALRKNKYISRSATLIYSVFEAISKRRFLHRKKSNTSYHRDHPQQQKEVSTHAEGEILVSLSPCLYAYYPNSCACVFHCLRKERFLHRKNQL